MGIRKHNQSNLQTERRLSSRAESFPSFMDFQNQNQAQILRLTRKIPASQKQDLIPQPGQKISSTTVAFAHRFDRWGRNPNEQKSARNWQNWYMFATSKGGQTIDTANKQCPTIFVKAGALVPERKNNFQKNYLEENNEKRFN